LGLKIVRQLTATWTVGIIDQLALVSMHLHARRSAVPCLLGGRIVEEDRCPGGGQSTEMKRR